MHIYECHLLLPSQILPLILALSILFYGLFRMIIYAYEVGWSSERFSPYHVIRIRTFNSNHKHTTILNPGLNHSAIVFIYAFTMIKCDDYMILRKG